jgi:hypothetical protein
MQLLTFLVTDETRALKCFVSVPRILPPVRFFSHLADVFGRRDFLPPICMLLLEKSANRVVRQVGDELQNTLSLPSTLFHQSGYDVQIHVSSFLSNILYIQ